MSAATNEATYLKVEKSLGEENGSGGRPNGRSASRGCSDVVRPVDARKSGSAGKLGGKYLLLTFTPICPRSSNPTLEVKLVHVFFGAVDPAVAKDNFVIYQPNFLVAGQTKIHSIGDLFAVQNHDCDFIHCITGD
jgi:hypothetical protein